MIQDIQPHHFDNTYTSTSEIKEDDFIFCFKDNALLMKQNSEALELIKKKDVTENRLDGVFLFTFNHTNCVLVNDYPDQCNDAFVFHEVHFRNPILQKELDWICSVALQLKNWYGAHLFCGKCGSKTKPKRDERAVFCPSCHYTKYPNIFPAIIVAILNEDKILLARNANFPEGFFSLVAGYVDVGESIEDAVAREVKEEVGLKVKNIRYYKSQPWPFSGSMMLGFVAQLDGDPTIRVDAKEITEAHWYTRYNLPNTPPNRSIAGEIIEMYVAEKLQ